MRARVYVPAARSARPAWDLTRALLVALLALALAAPGAVAASPRASLTTIERQVMCVTCRIPLEVAQSTQADRERAFIAGLIREGRDEAQIKQALVAQYGPAVLALPSAHGFDLTAYLVPAAVLLALIALLAVLLPRWRRRPPDLAGAAARGLDAADAERLESDMARFD